MSNLDTNHVVNLDLIKDRTNNVINFGLADVETSDFYLGLYNNGSRVFDKNYIVTLYIVKPNGTFRNIKLEPKEGLKKYYCNLPDNLKNIPGEYLCQAIIFDNLTNEKKISKSKFKYSVDLDLASEIAGIISEEEQETILTDILNRILTLENPVEPYATQKHVDECVSMLTGEIDTIKVKNTEQDDRVTSIESKNTEQDNRLANIEEEDVEQNDRLTNIESKNTEQDNRLNSLESKDLFHEFKINNLGDKNIEQDNRLDNIETKNIEQDNRFNLLKNKVDGIDEKIIDTIEPSLDNYGNKLDALETKDIEHEQRMTNIETKNTEQDNRLNTLENKDVEHELRMTNIESKNTEQDNRLTSIEGINATQNNRLDTLEAKDIVHELRMTDIEAKNIEQDNRLDVAENRLANIGNDITNTMQPIIDEHTSRLEAIEAIDVAQNARLDAIEAKNQQQDDRLLAIERVNERQDADLEILLGEPSNDMTEITKRGNSIYLQNSVVGHCEIDNIQGNTLVNCNKEPNKQLILNGDINTSAVSSVTLTEGVNGGKVDVALEGNTLVNVSKTKDSTAITKSYTVENSGNYIALQGDVNGSCRPVITGNTLWIDNATGEVLTEFNETKNLRLQSTFEDNLVTQEMIDSGGEIADNLDKYRVDYRVTGKNKFDKSKTLDEYAISQGKIVQQPNWFVTDFIPVIPNTSYSISGKPNGSGVIYYDNNKQTLRTSIGGTSLITVPNGAKYVRLNGLLTQKDTFQLEEGNTTTEYEPYKGHIKTLYLNSPLLEGDTIEEKDGGIYHVHRSELVEYAEGDETSLITDRVHTLHQLASPRYELIEQSNLVIPSYSNGHLDFNTAVPVEKVEFKSFSEELTYLYAGTQYTIQFVSDKATVVDLILGGTSLLARSIVVGLNRISITTPSELVDNKLIINGNGIVANISEVVVTDTDKEFRYFEGMKSVGEGGNLVITSSNSDNSLSNTQTLTHTPLRSVGEAKDRYVLLNGNWYIERKCGIRAYQEGDKDNYKTDLINTVYPLEMPAYEEIDYSPLEVYSGTTHITTNSAVPTNIIVKNHGFNCLLKPSTTYTISSNLGLNTVTTPSTLTEDCLRFMDTDTSDVTTMKNVLVLEGDWTTKADVIPSNFSGIESAFEQELVTDIEDAHYGKYKVNVKVANENNSAENNMVLYINEPLRGIGSVKDKIYVKDNKVVVERKCGAREYQDGDFGTYPTDKVNTVYPLAEPIYEEVEYNGVKLLIETFKNSTLSYNSNVAVTSTVRYSYSVPIVDTVAQTANVTDQQDSMIIDLATQCAVMEMYLM